MAKNVTGIEGSRDVRTLGGEPYVLDTHFTTDGSGVATMGFTNRGMYSIEKSSNTYTINFGCLWEETMACIVTHALAATVDHTLTIDPAAGTVAIAFSGAIASSRVDVSLKISASKAR